MPPKKKAKSSTKIEKARRYLAGNAGTLSRDDSDDELGTEDHPWEWIYGEGASKKLDRKAEREIVAAKMGTFVCQVGDTVFLKSTDNQAWVGLICEFGTDHDGEMAANFMWFSSQEEIRNKSKRRMDCLPNELYVSPSWDWNPLVSINGTAIVMSYDRFIQKYPKGVVPRKSRDHGKIFVCRRGCNTRTATYTDEFSWDKIYTGGDDLGDLIYLIKTQTKATRKRSAKAEKGEEDYNDAAAIDHDTPQTPRKKRKLDADITTPTSKRTKLTPRKFITPTHKRIVVKKALEITPLGTRVLSPSVLSSPYQLARNQLHVSSVPAALPCREDEFGQVYNHLESAITAGTGSCIYIAGTPGTGKTATVREVVAQLNAAVMAEELDDFIFVEINGMKITEPHQSYSLLWEALRGDRVTPAHALELLEREFSTPSPRRVPCVVLMDELDQLVTKNQGVMYNFFNWPSYRHSRLIVLAVANTMDLPERTLSNKISSRLGLTRITFAGYTHAQLIQIIESRLAHVPGNIVHPDAIQFASRKVAAVSGDARRALDICRRAVEIAEAQALSDDASADPTPNTPSKSGRGKKFQGSQKTAPIVTIATIKQAISEATSSPLQQALRALPLSAKVFLAALLARIRRTGVGEALVGDVLDETRKLALMTSHVSIREILLGEGRDDDPFHAQRKTSLKISGLVPRMYGAEDAIIELGAGGIIGLEARKGERTRRVRLNIGDEEVTLALKEDEEVRGLGFN
jgi:origin recognition complex subunit 1